MRSFMTPLPSIFVNNGPLVSGGRQPVSGDAARRRSADSVQMRL